MLTGEGLLVLLRADALDVIELCEIAYGEGLLPDGAPMLVIRIAKLWPDIVPQYLLEDCTR